MYKFRGLLISLCSLIVSLIALEIFLWLFAPVPDPYEKYYQYFNQFVRKEYRKNYRDVTELEAALPGADGENVFSTNNMGFRGDYLTMPKPENEFRIFILGSSIAENYYLDDSESLDAVLQKELGKQVPESLSVKVYNAGQSANNSDDFISMLVHRVVHLEPDMIIVYGPDLYPPLRDHDYLHYMGDAPKKKFPLLHFLATEFQIPRRVYYLVKQIAPTDEELIETVTLKSRHMQMIEKLSSIPVSDERPKTNIPAYRKNLITIIGTAKAHKIKVVLMTSQSTWNSTIDPEVKKYHLGLFYGEKQFREDFMQDALESYNDAMRKLSVEYSVPVFDSVKIMPKSTEYFYDDYHFHKKGAYFAGKHLASFILQAGLIKH